MVDEVFFYFWDGANGVTLRRLQVGSGNRGRYTHRGTESSDHGCVEHNGFDFAAASAEGSLRSEQNGDTRREPGIPQSSTLTHFYAQQTRTQDLTEIRRG